jgi:hypothetical protein
MTSPDGSFPSLLRIRQRIPAHETIDVERTLDDELTRRAFFASLGPGSRVVVAAGSRGIPNYPTVIHRLVRRLLDIGAQVSILPAMGSHGGGTAPGQVLVLELLGISDRTVGAPVIDTMDVEEMGVTASGITVFADRTLKECDAVVLVNRIKQHTEFHGSIQSGLLKMIAIGLGRARGAAEVHRHAVRLGYEKAILEVARFCLERLPILGGVAMIDGPEGGTAHLEVIPSSEIESAERRWVQTAAGLALKLPLEEIDILIVDRLGKDISGAGMDTKVIGRMGTSFEPDLEAPRIRRIFVRDLSEATHGNAIGIGLADFTTRRLIEKIDRQATNLNCLTAITPEKARLPMALENDRQALLAAMATNGHKDAENLRLVWIQDTLHLARIVASPAAVRLMKPDSIVTLGDPFGFAFDGADDLVSPWEGFPLRD